MHISLVCLVASVATLGAACSTPLDTDRSFNQVSYDFTWHRSCFCDPEARRPIRISVADDRIASAVFVDDGQPVPQRIRSGLATINGVFELIQQAQDTGGEVSATFDTEMGYPASVIFDGSKRPADGGMELYLYDVVVRGQ